MWAEGDWGGGERKGNGGNSEMGIVCMREQSDVGGGGWEIRKMTAHKNGGGLILSLCWIISLPQLKHFTWPLSH